MNKAFTLIELLIVVAIIAILAAIAVPNFLEAQVRSKVSSVKSNMRSTATALESYFVDNNHYPPEGYFHNGTFTIAAVADAKYSLVRLSTPVCYITSADACTRDPFMENARGYNPAATPPYYEVNNFFYVSYETFEQTRTVPASFPAWFLQSHGPGKTDNTTSWLAAFVVAGSATVANFPDYIVYDPTNGTVSNGDICRLGGAIPASVLNHLQKIERLPKRSAEFPLSQSKGEGLRKRRHSNVMPKHCGDLQPPFATSGNRRSILATALIVITHRLDIVVDNLRIQTRSCCESITSFKEMLLA